MAHAIAVRTFTAYSFQADILHSSLILCTNVWERVRILRVRAQNTCCVNRPINKLKQEIFSTKANKN